MSLSYSFSTLVEPNDFRDVENADGIMESSHKNGIYCITRNFTECHMFDE